MGNGGAAPHVQLHARQLRVKGRPPRLQPPALDDVGIGVFAFKGLWLTVVPYTLFAAWSVVGWSARRRIEAQGG